MTTNALYDFFGLNSLLFQWINNYDYPMAVVVFLRLVSEVSHYTNFPYYVLAGAVWLAVRIYQGRQLTGAAVRLPVQAMLVLFIGYWLNSFWVPGLKEFFLYPRPYVALPADLVVLRTAIEPTEAYVSFPSGHMAFATLIAFAFWPALGSAGRWLMAAFVLCVGWSRIVLGVHFPVDLLASLVIQLTLLGLAHRLVAWPLSKIGKMRTEPKAST